MVKLTNPEDTLLPTGSNMAINASASTANGANGIASSNTANLRPASVGGAFGSDIESSNKRFVIFHYFVILSYVYGCIGNQTLFLT